MTGQELREKISQLVAEFHKTISMGKTFIPGKTPIRYAGRVFDEKEIQAAVDASLDFWLTEGRFAEKFQDELAEKIGVKYALLTNSGSSANLLAVTALTSPKLGDRQLKPGDEVITVASGFPTVTCSHRSNVLIAVPLPNGAKSSRPGTRLTVSSIFPVLMG